MDKTTKVIVDYLDSVWNIEPPAETVDAVKQHLLDSLGCLVAAHESAPAQVAVEVAKSSRSEPGSTVFVNGLRTSVELAAFANTTMVRYLDFNDAYNNVKGGLHPSDTSPALMAIAEAEGLSGQQLVIGIAASYEILRSLSDAVSLRLRGWDHVLWLSVAVAAVGAKMMGGTSEQVGHAVSLAIVPNVALRQTRSGELSMWKAVAAAAAARSGIFAARVAVSGMAGPPLPFEGEHGLFDSVTGDFELQLPSNAVPAVLQTSIKLFPTEYHSQSILSALDEMRDEVPCADIADIDVQTYAMVVGEIGSGDVKWRPTNRETADHSLPYVMASMLRYGTVGLDDFTESRINDPLTWPVMDLVSVTEVAELTAAFPATMTTRINITLKDGRVVTRTTSYPKGHFQNPMAPEQVSAKFRGLAGRVGQPQWVAEIERAVDGIDKAESLKDLIASLILHS